MHMIISAEKSIDLRNVKVERVGDSALWVYTMQGNLYMDNEAARELMRQMREALGDNERDTAALVAECDAADAEVTA